MKTKILSALSLMLCLLMLFTLVSCNAGGDPWSDARYTEDTELGTGATTVLVEVKVGEHAVTFTLHTDKTVLGDALLEHDLIAGEAGDYGLYVKVVNGITADYDVDQSYWGFYKGGEYLMTGVDTTTVADGEHYEIVYTK